MVRFFATTALLSSLLATTSWAQAAGLQADNEGGFKLSDDGQSRLHLGLDAGIGFDTNPYSATLDTADFSGDVIGRIRPYLDVSTGPGSLLQFKGKASLDYGFLPGVIDPDTQQFLLYQANVAADLEVNRGGMFSFAAGDTLSWSSDPGVATVGTLLNRLTNQLRLGTGFTPGGGTLGFRLGYTFDFSKFFDVDGVQSGSLIEQGALDTMRHGLNLRADYRFLPKTGVFANLGAGWQSYPFTNTQPQAFPVSVLVGIQGNFLPRLGGMAAVGYSNPLVLKNGAIDSGDILGVSGQLEVQWQISQQSTLAAGFQRRIDPMALYQYVTNNRFYARFQQGLLGRFVLTANAGYSILEFGDEEGGGLTLTDRPTGRLDGNLNGTVSLNYYFFDWLSVGLANDIDWRVTNANDVSDGTPVNLGYLRNQTLALLSVRY